MNLKHTETILRKTLTLLCFLILPLLFYILTAYLTAAVFQRLLDSTNENSAAARFLQANLPLLYSGAAAIFTSGALGYFYFQLKKNPVQQNFPPAAGSQNSNLRFPSDRSFPFSGYLYVILFGALGAVFFNLLLELSRLPELFPTSGTIEAATAMANPFLHFLSVCLIVPAAEELVFRGLGYFGLRRLFGSVFTSILTSVLFGVFHGNAPQTLYGFCMGLLLAHTAESCRNLTALLLFHWAANITSFTLLRDPAGQKLLYSVPLLGLSGIACAWLFYRIKKLNS